MLYWVLCAEPFGVSRVREASAIAEISGFGSLDVEVYFGVSREVVIPAEHKKSRPKATSSVLS
jgi:hypothetical protein